MSTCLFIDLDAVDVVNRNAMLAHSHHNNLVRNILAINAVCPNLNVIALKKSALFVKLWIYKYYKSV
jgi:hypothetical protein